jgi:hypothetical protein
MPVTIPAGTKFEAIKPTTNVNRRSALVNANDLTYTIEDIAAAAGGGASFPIATGYMPKADALGNLVQSSLYESAGNALNGTFSSGILFESAVGVNLLNVDNFARYMNFGDIFGITGTSFGLKIDGDPFSGVAQILWNGNAVLNFIPSIAEYKFGGTTTKFGIINADVSQCSLSVSPDLVVNIGGTDYIKVDVNGTIYNIELVP